MLGMCHAGAPEMENGRAIDDDWFLELCVGGGEVLLLSGLVWSGGGFRGFGFLG